MLLRFLLLGLLLLLLLAVMTIVAGLVGGRCGMERVVAGVGWVGIMVDLGAVCWVVVVLVVVVLVDDMVVEVDMDARLGHCSAATREGQRHISRLRD